MRATPWPSSWSRQAAWPPPASRPSWTSSPRASTSGLPWQWAPLKTCWSTSPSVRNTPKSEAAANGPSTKSLASPFLRGGNVCRGIRTHSKKKPKLCQSCAKKKHFYSSHYLHFCLKMHVYSAKRTKYMFLCSTTVCLLLADEGLNKVSTIPKHQFQLFTL